MRGLLLLFLPLLAACGGAPPPPAAPAAQEPGASAAAAPASPASPPALAPVDPAELARLGASDVAQRSNVVPAGKQERYGHAEVLVRGPADKVRRVLLDFPHYKDIVPRKFHNARVVAKDKGQTDLYMQVPIMRGMITLWDILRFGPITATASGEVLEGRFVRGNVKDANIVLTMRPVSDTATILKCDLLILPKVPAPQSAIDEELRDAAGDALDGIKRRVEVELKGGVSAPAAAPASPPPAPG